MQLQTIWLVGNDILSLPSKVLKVNLEATVLPTTIAVLRKTSSALGFCPDTNETILGSTAIVIYVKLLKPDHDLFRGVINSHGSNE